MCVQIVQNKDYYYILFPSLYYQQPSLSLVRTQQQSNTVGTLQCQSHVEDIHTFERVARSKSGYKH